MQICKFNFKNWTMPWPRASLCIQLAYNDDYRWDLNTPHAIRHVAFAGDKHDGGYSLIRGILCVVLNLFRPLPWDFFYFIFLLVWCSSTRNTSQTSLRNGTANSSAIQYWLERDLKKTCVDYVRPPGLAISQSSSKSKAFSHCFSKACFPRSWHDRTLHP